MWEWLLGFSLVICGMIHYWLGWWWIWIILMIELILWWWLQPQPIQPPSLDPERGLRAMKQYTAYWSQHHPDEDESDDWSDDAQSVVSVPITVGYYLPEPTASGAEETSTNSEEEESSYAVLED